MLIVLPLPPRTLSPNARTHWAPKARSVRLYRNLAMVTARQEMRGEWPEWDKAEVRATFYVPDNRRRDPDNLMASCKAIWDGFVDAHVLSDDKALIIHPPQVVVDRKWPRLELEITEAVA